MARAWQPFRSLPGLRSCLFAPRPPSLDLVAIGQAKLLLHVRHGVQQLPLTLFGMGLWGKSPISGILEGGNNKGVEFVAAGEVLAGDFPRALSELRSRHVALEIVPEQIHHQPPPHVMPTAQMARIEEEDGGGEQHARRDDRYGVDFHGGRFRRLNLGALRQFHGLGMHRRLNLIVGTR